MVSLRTAFPGAHHLRYLLPLALLLPAVALAETTGPPIATERADGATAKKQRPRYNLRQLVSLARASYPGVEAARQAIAAMEGQVYRARWSWLPQGTVKGLLAPAPEISCYRVVERNGTLEKVRDQENCMQTSAFSVNSFSVAGVLARIELEAGMPLYTFDKLGSAKRAAAAGLTLRRAQLEITQDKLALDVTKAYWGLKLAREILYTVREGRGYVVDAEKTVQKNLDEGQGEYTITDQMRLRVARAEIDVRLVEAEKLERLTLAALTTLTGKRGQPFDVDTQILDVIPGSPLPLRSYLSLSRSHRPEVKLLEAAVQARSAAVDLERARFFPDFLLVGMVGYGYTSSVDDPKNAFYSDPFNFLTAGIGLALSWRLDHVLQLGQYRTARAEQREAVARRSEALAGIELEIQSSWIALDEARRRLEASAKGERTARRWLVATSQNLAAGLGEPKDLMDALLAYFQLRLRYLQAIYDVNVGWSELGRVIGVAAARR